jgi:hypothetical protein
MNLTNERARRAKLFPPGARCEDCGESDPIVLDAGNVCNILCAEHSAIRQGKSPMEEHHLAGWRYSAVVVVIPANMHRRLTALQRLRAQARRKGDHEAKLAA